MDTSFRFDINALRAIAVIGVVAYHFDLGVVPGGYVGVDVFFVVSGFLMTRIISSRLAAGQFSFLDFYAARARRILPALTMMVLVVGGFGVLAMGPLRLEKLSQDCVATLLFFSNYSYLHQGDYGYFSSPPNHNWLLHTWSLSLEWQFYFILPIFLMILYCLRLSRLMICAIIFSVSLLSFADALTGKDVWELKTAFYTLPARTWEFLMGALCALAPSHNVISLNWRRRVHYFGLTLIGWAMITLTGLKGWPSGWTLLPTLGTALVLLANHRDGLWSRAYATCFIGRSSYSIYLWHWPIAAALSYFSLWSLSARLVGIVFSLVCAAISYRLIEARAMDGLSRYSFRAVGIGAASFALPLVLALVSSATGGLEAFQYAKKADLRAELAGYRAAAADWQYPESCDHLTKEKPDLEICTFGDPKARDVLVIGDSFARELTPRYKGRLLNSPRGITFLTRSSCPLLLNIDRRIAGLNCTGWADRAYTFAESHDFKRVVFIDFWASNNRVYICLKDEVDCGDHLSNTAFSAAFEDSFDRMAQRWRRLSNQGKEVVVFEMMPKGGGDPDTLYQKAVEGGQLHRSVQLSLKSLMQARTERHATLARAAATADAIMVEPTAFLCANGECPIVENGRTLFKDEWHFRASTVRDARFSFVDDYLLWKPRSIQSSMASSGH